MKFFGPKGSVFHEISSSGFFSRKRALHLSAGPLLWSVLCSVHLEPLEVRGALGPAGGAGERPGPHLLSKVQTLRSDLHGLSGLSAKKLRAAG